MKWISFFLVLFCFVACNPSKKIGRTVSKKEAKTISEVYAAYDAKKIQYQNLEAKLKVRYKDSKTSMPFRATVRIEKDKQVWLSAGMFGFEAVRALVTPDSVQVINRLRKEYYKEPVSKIQSIAGLPVNFEMLENLLTGNILVRNENDIKYVKLPESIEISSKVNFVELITRFHEKDYQLKSQHLKDTLNHQAMDVFYSNYQNVGDDFVFPFKNNVEVKGEEIFIDIEFLSIELDKSPSFDFKINKRYEQKMF